MVAVSRPQTFWIVSDEFRPTCCVFRQDAPGKAYTISEKDKTYSETEISNTPGNENKEDYEITLIGKELVNGYSCTHATALNKKTKRTSEVWLSKDVKGYAEYTSLRNTYLGGSKFFEALKEKGAEGFVVRSVMVDGKGENMQMDLVKAEKKDIDETMFSLDGYTRKAVAGMPGGMLPQTAEQIQKMTPGERQKYMEDMKAKYGQPH